MEKTKGIRHELEQLYASHLANFVTAIAPILNDPEFASKPTGPLLLSFENEEDFRAADIRLMAFAAHPDHSWSNFEGNMLAGMQHYELYVNQGTCWNSSNYFWNAVSQFLALLKAEFPNKRIHFAYNTLHKCCYPIAEGIEDLAYEIEQQKFHVIQEELRILQPTIVLFLTGTHHDRIISNTY